MVNLVPAMSASLLRSALGVLAALCVSITGGFCATPDVRILPPFQTLETVRPGVVTTSIVTLPDGTLATVDGNTFVRSHDAGQTWGEATSIYTGVDAATAKTGVPTGQMRLILTRAGTLVLIWRDPRVDHWNKTTHEMEANATGSVWTMRSTDLGKTWGERQKLFDGVCGHPPIHLLQLRDGTLVTPIQYYINAPLRCVIRPYTSKDDGKTWVGGNIIDLGGHGNHDGAFEPSLVELRDGRVWMLIRTNWDRYWEAFSDDGGRSFRTIRPSSIVASSSPPYVMRLSDGRLMLFWNQLYPVGQTSYERRSGNYSEVAGSWHREEISVVFSSDEGASWTPPVIMARQKKTWLSYVYAFEVKPGELWIFSLQGKISAKVEVADIRSGAGAEAVGR